MASIPNSTISISRHAALRFLEFSSPSAMVARGRTNYYLGGGGVGVGASSKSSSLSLRQFPALKSNQFLVLLNPAEAATNSKITYWRNINHANNCIDNAQQVLNISSLRNHQVNAVQVSPKTPISSSQQQQQQAQADQSSSNEKKPSLEQQLKVYNSLKDCLPKLFLQPMDYTIYHKKLIFINNLIGKTTTGLESYMRQVSLLRTIGHFKFAFVKFNVINMSHDVETSRITVRWRIVGISGLKVMIKFWKYKLWKREELIRHQETWYDGISYFDIGSDGLIHRHIADKMEEDKDRLEAIKASKTPLAAKLAVLGALIPKPNIQEGLALSCTVTGGIESESTLSTLSDFLISFLL